MRKKLWLSIAIGTAVLAAAGVLATRGRRDWLYPLRANVTSDQTMYFDYSRMMSSMPASAKMPSMPPVRLRIVQFSGMKPGTLRDFMEKHYARSNGWHWHDMLSMGAPPGTQRPDGTWIVISKNPSRTAAFSMGMPAEDYIMYFEGDMSSTFLSIRDHNSKELANAMVIEYHPMKAWEVWYVRVKHIGSDPFDSSKQGGFFGP